MTKAKKQSEPQKVEKNYTLDCLRTSMGMLSDGRLYDDYFERYGYRKDYTIDDVEAILSSGDIDSMRFLSQTFYSISGYYQQHVNYFATLLKYCGLLIPNPKLGGSLQNNALRKKYFHADKAVSKLKLQSLGPHIAKQVLLNGICYYAVSEKTNKNIELIELPCRFSRSRFKAQDGHYLVEFNVEYFDMLDPIVRPSVLGAYPAEVSTYYESWSRKREGSAWLLLPDTVGRAFVLFEKQPLFLSIIPSIIKNERMVDIEDKKQANEQKKILITEMPHLNDGKLVFEPDEVKIMHDGAAQMVQKSNDDVSVYTTYGKAEVADLGAKDGLNNKGVENSKSNIYSTSGTSAELFASSTSSGLSTSTKLHLATMMTLGNQIAAFIEDIVNEVYGNGAVSFSYKMLPVSYLNENDFIDESLKLATNGYPLLIPMAAQGISAHELINIKEVENDVLELGEVLKPLRSSYTETETTQSDEGGRPTKTTEKKAETTIKKDESKDRN